MTRRKKSIATATALGLLGLVVLCYVVSNIFLACGLHITAAIFPTAAIAAAAATAFLVAPGRRIKVLTIFIGTIVISLVAGVFFIDFSYDGIMYHQEIIAALVDGWNPFNVEELIPDHKRWTNHYAKAIETVAATIVSFLGQIESGKAVNFILFFSTLALVYGFISETCPALSLWKRAGVVLAVVCNPVVICQLPSYYIDSSGYIYLLWTLWSLWQISREDSAATGTATLLCVTILAIGTKFNVFFYQGLWIFMAIVWFAAKRMWKATARVSAIGVAGLIAGVAIAWHPYVTNVIAAGHPLFPLMGEGCSDIMTDNTPDAFGHGRVSDFFHSLCMLQLPTLAGPFAGFGFLMPVMLLLSAIVLVRVRKSVPGVWIYIICCSLLSCFIFEQTWWARYIPQLWLVPAAALYVAVRYTPSGLFTKVFFWVMLANIPLCIPQQARAFWSYYRYRMSMREVLSGDRVTLVNPAVQIERMLTEENIRYEIEDSIPKNHKGDVLLIYGFGDETGDNIYPLLVLTAEQTARMHKSMTDRRLKYYYFKFYEP